MTKPEIRLPSTYQYQLKDLLIWFILVSFVLAIQCFVGNQSLSIMFALLSVIVCILLKLRSFDRPIKQIAFYSGVVGVSTFVGLGMELSIVLLSEPETISSGGVVENLVVDFGRAFAKVFWSISIMIVSSFVCVLCLIWAWLYPETNKASSTGNE